MKFIIFQACINIPSPKRSDLKYKKCVYYICWEKITILFKDLSLANIILNLTLKRLEGVNLRIPFFPHGLSQNAFCREKAKPCFM